MTAVSPEITATPPNTIAMTPLTKINDKLIRGIELADSELLDARDYLTGLLDSRWTHGAAGALASTPAYAWGHAHGRDNMDHTPIPLYHPKD